MTILAVALAKEPILRGGVAVVEYDGRTGETYVRLRRADDPLPAPAPAEVEQFREFARRNQGRG